ncbi:MAG TPA: YihY/virulence factor BrkB family protein [Caulobacteraceae bacterium]|nr:YihY/virulence factor BrkB family protein [Caulobacteraceae bacterium]
MPQPFQDEDQPKVPDNSEAPQVAAREPERGRGAEHPTEIPPKGWKDIIWRALREFREDSVPAVSQSIAFSGMLALFPALAAFVSIYGLFADVATARDHLAGLTGLVPAGAATFIGEQMIRIAAQTEATLSTTFALSILLSIWSANGGMKALFAGLNIAYDENERRNFFKLNLITLAFTLGGVIFLSLAMGAVIAVPVILNVLRLDSMAWMLALLRWPLLLVLTMLVLAVVYRYGPSRQEPKWRWVSLGSVTASVLWLIASIGFSWYLSNFADYNATYGSLGTVFGFMMWLWLSSMVVLLGAEINAEAERQTVKDSTTGEEKPLGDRGAVAADTVGEAKTDSMLPGFIAKRLH